MNVHDNTPTMVISIQTKNLVVVNCKLIIEFHQTAMQDSAMQMTSGQVPLLLHKVHQI